MDYAAVDARCHGTRRLPIRSGRGTSGPCLAPDWDGVIIRASWFGDADPGSIRRWAFAALPTAPQRADDQREVPEAGKLSGRRLARRPRLERRLGSGHGSQTADELVPDTKYRNTATDVGYMFGSAHPGGVNALLADGSVRVIIYTIDRVMWDRLESARTARSTRAAVVQSSIAPRSTKTVPHASPAVVDRAERAGTACSTYLTAATCRSSRTLSISRIAAEDSP